MDPNPTKFPILSYVMSKLPSRNNHTTTSSPDFDIEQPPPPPPSSSSENDDNKPYFEITERMPYLTDPDLIASMRATVADVSRTRSVLKTLGDCPDHELVDIARSKLAEMEMEKDADVADRLDDVALNVDDDVAVNVDLARSKLSELEKEKDADVAGGKVEDDVAKERSVFEAVVKVYEMHERYEKMLTEAERKLEKLYNEAKRGGRGKGVVGSGEGSSRGLDVDVEVDEGVTEEVVGILNEALASNAERVDLSEKRLPVLPEAFGKLKMLVSLKLSSNQLEVLPDSIAGLENLEELYVSSNLLESLPDSIGLLLKLKILDVSSNKLTSLPDSICHCRSLVELDASFNKLTYIPTKIGYELENLKKFSVHLNKIRSLPTSIGEMTSLQVLDVHFNELGVVPPSIGRLSNLEILNLSGNFSDLTSLPFTIGDLTNLKELDISNNQIRELPVTFGRLENLKKLNLGENPLVIPPKEVVDEGVESVKEFMAKRLLDALIEEEEKSKIVENQEQAQGGGWLTRSTSWLTNAVGGYLATKKDTTNEDPYLNQQL